MQSTASPGRGPERGPSRRGSVLAVAAIIVLALVVVLATLPLTSVTVTVTRPFGFDMVLPAGDVRLVPAGTYCDPLNSAQRATVAFVWNTTEGTTLQRFGLFLALGLNEYAALYFVTNSSSGGFAYFSPGVCSDPMEYVASAPSAATIAVTGLIAYPVAETAPIL